MVSNRQLNGVVKLLWHTCHQELRKGLKVIATLLGIKDKKAISIDGIVNHVVWRKTAELHDLQQLVIVVLPRKNGSFNEELNDCAAEGPHVNRVIVRRHLGLLFVHLRQICAKKYLWSPVISRLYVSVYLLSVERSASKIYELNVEAALVYEDVLWLQIAVDKVDVFAGHKGFKNLS